MPLPEWAEKPGIGYQCVDDYSPLEVIWSHPHFPNVVQYAPGIEISAPEGGVVDPAALEVEPEVVPAQVNPLGVEYEPVEVADARRELGEVRFTPIAPRESRLLGLVLAFEAGCAWGLGFGTSVSLLYELVHLLVH